MRIIISLVLNALAVLVAASVVPGVDIDSFWTAVLVAVVLGLLNTFVKPLLILLTLPLTIVTLGLFTLVVNTLVIMLASALVPGFSVGSFLSALVFSIILSLVTFFLSTLGR